ncbi:deoxyribodipyrimidine photolyase [Mycobacterium intermedium]|uniref:Deoxyribodipyrimidine photolyase n=1 Tax=Mycobacterium intermedium TaxID=28445 RepID=A0A1E3S814_MYCIE|nr:deoxyribodipyrimidine photo-lyase [Mycobacterium intermedium]MCV6964194.1 deoxyribodipyrimidine photo-lyase [Mycobacterium intermedium]ODQ98305.1 deoxyribodipyrimidine photolyase [Mycobacterium intermedium]OPE47716.1 deoxyribodipyrimidine photolyase [Mycobacterium intermedium]ORB03372.1 deoxyribodipyrimidine photolyase [Mycobacterium intermedium]
MTTLLWFRRDLRLGDHPALTAAAAAAADGAPDETSTVLACFVVDPRLEASSGQRRLQFLGDALRQLNADLDGRLLVVRGRPEQRIPEIVERIGASSVHISADYAPFGRRRDERVREALDPVPLVATGSPYLVSPGRVTKPDGTPYKVFTPFFAQWREAGWRQPAKAGRVRWLEPSDIEQCEIPDPGVALDVTAGEAAALSQWAAFVDDGLQRYADDRNRPDLPGTSRMSAHLKFGTIHPRTMVNDLNPRRQGDAAYLRELAFRDFYASVLHHWPDSAWWNWNREFDAIQTDTDADAERRFEAWKAGETGFPLVDAGMRQLRETGWLHNRLRMVVASFLVKDLHLPWQWGARWFLDQLVDGDLANNQHGWQWTAGCGTDAAPYFRVFNPDRQGEKFDPSGDYVRRWVPELADVSDVRLRKGDRPADYPRPIVDHAAERTEALRRYQDLG